MTPPNRAPGWGSQPSANSESSRMLRKSRVGKGEGEPMRCVSCWMVRPSAKQRACLCVRCDACVANNSEAHKGTCTGGKVND